MVKELANRLGLGDYFPYDHIEDHLDFQLKSLGSSLEEIKKSGVKLLDRETPLYLADNEDYEFDTPSGKIELYSTQLAEYNFDPMPVYTKHEEPPEGFYRLLYGRAPMHTFGRMTNNPLLLDLKKENEVWISKKVAKEWGIQNNEYVLLSFHLELLILFRFFVY